MDNSILENLIRIAYKNNWTQPQSILNLKNYLPDHQHHILTKSCSYLKYLELFIEYLCSEKTYNENIYDEHTIKREHLKLKNQTNLKHYERVRILSTTYFHRSELRFLFESDVKLLALELISPVYLCLPLDFSSYLKFIEQYCDIDVRLFDPNFIYLVALQQQSFALKSISLSGKLKIDKIDKIDKIENFELIPQITPLGFVYRFDQHNKKRAIILLHVNFIIPTSIENDSDINQYFVKTVNLETETSKMSESSVANYCNDLQKKLATGKKNNSKFRSKMCSLLDYFKNI